MKDKQARERIEVLEQLVGELINEVTTLTEEVGRLKKEKYDRESKFRTHDG